MNLRKIREFSVTIVIAFIFAFGIRFFLYEPFYVPSGSMKPNLLIGDYMMVSKYSYGYGKYSFPFGKIFSTREKYAKNIKRGDVAVFKPLSSPKNFYVKRVIGLPGDDIEFIDGIIFVNNIPMKQNIIGDFFDKDTKTSLIKLSEEISKDKSILILNEKHETVQDNTINFKVPEKSYFVVGDNRDNSDDSRVNVGFVPEENFIGRAVIILFSIDKSQGFNLFKIIRFDRLFSLID
ncbi:signal peptidase I [Flavobacteriaceae bacterium]|nr:signal peptidase I [Flavobacteriaceae bacterium]